MLAISVCCNQHIAKFRMTYGSGLRHHLHSAKSIYIRIATHAAKDKGTGKKRRRHHSVCADYVDTYFVYLRTSYRFFLSTLSVYYIKSEELAATDKMEMAVNKI